MSGHSPDDESFSRPSAVDDDKAIKDAGPLRSAPPPPRQKLSLRGMPAVPSVPPPMPSIRPDALKEMQGASFDDTTEEISADLFPGQEPIPPSPAVKAAPSPVASVHHEILQALRRQREAHPHDDLAKIDFEIALVLEEERRPRNDVLNQLERVLGNAPRHALALREKRRLLLAERRIASAVDVLADEAASTPHDSLRSSLWFLRGHLQQKQLGQNNDAQSSFAQAVRADQHDLLAQRAVLQTQFSLGQIDEASATGLSIAMQSRDTDSLVAAHLFAAAAHEAAGRMKEAVEATQSACAQAGLRSYASAWLLELLERSKMFHDFVEHAQAVASECLPHEQAIRERLLLRAARVAEESLRDPARALQILEQGVRARGEQSPKHGTAHSALLSSPLLSSVASLQLSQNALEDAAASLCALAQERAGNHEFAGSRTNEGKSSRVQCLVWAAQILHTMWRNQPERSDLREQAVRLCLEILQLQEGKNEIRHMLLNLLGREDPFLSKQTLQDLVKRSSSALARARLLCTIGKIETETNSKDSGESLESYRRALLEDPSNDLARRVLTSSISGARDVNAALGTLRFVAHSSASELRRCLVLGQLLDLQEYVLGDALGASATMTHFLPLHARWSSAYGLARALELALQCQDFDRAYELSQDLLPLLDSAEQVSWLLGLCDHAAHFGRPDKAEQWLQAALALKSTGSERDHRISLHMQSNLLRQQNRASELIRSLELELELESEPSERLLLLSELVDLPGSIDSKREAWWEQLLEINPVEPRALFELIQLQKARGDYDALYKTLEHRMAAADNEGSATLASTAQAACDLARIHEEQMHDAQKALRLYELADEIESKQDQALAQTPLGSLFFEVLRTSSAGCLRLYLEQKAYAHALRFLSGADDASAKSSARISRPSSAYGFHRAAVLATFQTHELSKAMRLLEQAQIVEDNFAEDTVVEDNAADDPLEPVTRWRSNHVAGHLSWLIGHRQKNSESIVRQCRQLFDRTQNADLRFAAACEMVLEEMQASHPPQSLVEGLELAFRQNSEHPLPYLLLDRIALDSVAVDGPVHGKWAEGRSRAQRYFLSRAGDAASLRLHQLQLGLALADEGKLNDAVAALRVAHEGANESYATAWFLATLAEAAKDAQTASLAYNRCAELEVQRSRSAWLHAHAGELAESVGLFDQALASFEASIRKEPLEETRIAQYFLLASKQNQLSHAVDRVVAAAASERSAAKFAPIGLFIAQKTHADLHDAPRALALLRVLVRAHPQYEPAWLLLADLSLQENLFAEAANAQAILAQMAEAFMNGELARSEADKLVLRERAAMHHAATARIALEHLGDELRAITTVQHALQKSPRFAPLLRLAAQLHLQRGELDRAFARSKELLAEVSSSERADVLTFIAEVELKRGREEQAIQCLGQAVRYEGCDCSAYDLLRSWPRGGTKGLPLAALVLERSLLSYLNEEAYLVQREGQLANSRTAGREKAAAALAHFAREARKDPSLAALILEKHLGASVDPRSESSASTSESSSPSLWSEASVQTRFLYAQSLQESGQHERALLALMDSVYWDEWQHSRHAKGAHSAHTVQLMHVVASALEGLGDAVGARSAHDLDSSNASKQTTFDPKEGDEPVGPSAAERLAWSARFAGVGQLLRIAHEIVLHPTISEAASTDSAHLLRVLRELEPVWLVLQGETPQGEAKLKPPVQAQEIFESLRTRLALPPMELLVGGQDLPWFDAKKESLAWPKTWMRGNESKMAYSLARFLVARTWGTPSIALLSTSTLGRALEALRSPEGDSGLLRLRDLTTRAMTRKQKKELPETLRLIDGWSEERVVRAIADLKMKASLLALIACGDAARSFDAAAYELEDSSISEAELWMQWIHPRTANLRLASQNK